MKQPRIVVVGSVNVDLVIKSPRLPGPGETIAGGRFTMAFGGKGANQAVAAARLGADVTLIAKVGGDRYGDEAIESFRREGINVDCIAREPETATGIALIMVDERGENLISVAGGANENLLAADIDRHAEQIRSAAALLVQLEIPLETAMRAAQIAAAAGVPVILDPAPARPLPAELLSNVDYLTPNEAEATQLTAIDVCNDATAREAAAKLLAAGSKQVIISLGEAGALLADRKRMTAVPSVPVAAVDTTAAGDAFNAAFAWRLGRGNPPDEAVRRACIAAALSTTRIGAQPSLPTAEELRDFINALPAQQR